MTTTRRRRTIIYDKNRLHDIRGEDKVGRVEKKMHELVIPPPTRVTVDHRRRST